MALLSKSTLSLNRLKTDTSLLAKCSPAAQFEYRTTFPA
jgi:hypothetical protein